MWLFTLCRRDGMSLMLVKKAVMAETWSATILAVGDKAAGMALTGMIGSSTAAHKHSCEFWLANSVRTGGRALQSRRLGAGRAPVGSRKA